jgi:hypothetical protein
MPDLIIAAAESEQIPPTLLAAIIQNESGFDPTRISRTGCVGLGQICKSSGARPTMLVQCNQGLADDGTTAPRLCAPTTCESEASYNFCDACEGLNSSCVTDDRFDISKNITQSAKILESKISEIQEVGCDLNTEAGVKAAAYSYNMGSGRIAGAIRIVGCDSYAAMWQQARDDFDTIACTPADNTCGGGQTCVAHPEFSGTICHEDGQPLGVVYRSSAIKLDKLERKRDTIEGSYVSKIYADFLRFGGASPNSTFFALTANASSNAAPLLPKPVHISVPNPIIKIPGLTFSGDSPEDFVVENNDGTKTLIIPFIGEYIAAVYRYAVGVMSVLAGIGIIIGGIMYMTTGAGGDVNQAKKVIGGSVVSIVFFASTYLILFTINPELIQLRNLEIPYLEGNSIHNENVVDGESPITNRSDLTVVQGSPSTIDSVPLGYGFNNVPWFFQYDSQWNSVTYGNESRCSSIGEGGCSPSSIAMVLKFYGRDVNPTHIASIAVETGARVCNRGTSLSSDYLERVAEVYNMQQASLSRTEALEFIRAGIPMVSGGAHRGWGSTLKIKRYDGHYIVFTGVDTITTESGDQIEIVRVNDPGNRVSRGISHMTTAQFLAESRTPTYFIPNDRADELRALVTP